ncbi:MAG TPA: S-adenosylmethionine:tRNA ribosyltransferase-isomerase [Pyrinomonadaceae bacterium]|nr:S-adenosylmethionine:tRNA ribosyltransferase-isomerase [Pyrinomonadaceae bacterium]
MKTSDFQFRVPERLIPLSPPELRGERREDARMVVLHRGRASIEHSRFDRLGSYLRAGDVLVVNDTLMVHDQLRGLSSRGPVTLVLFGHHANGWHAAVRPAARAARGLVVRVGGGELRAVLVKRTIGDLWLVRFEHDGDFYELLGRYGERNLPLYKPLRERMETYRNVYARVPGSLEIPSAGLHFTEGLLARLARAGVSVVPVTLHIGLTELQQYRHITEEEVEEHRVGAEWYRVKPAAARAINRARGRGGRVVAVGTSVVRTLETVAAQTRAGARVRAGEGWTELYIYPGYRYKAVDAMLTNLHEPRSSHLLLVAAFAGKEFTLDAYRQLVRARYRFDLFGDSMLIL